jgi:hypothetical protein
LLEGSFVDPNMANAEELPGEDMKGLVLEIAA